MAITKAVLNLAHGLKLAAIAEGIETDEQLAWLMKQDCEEFQGYLFSKPLPAEAVETLFMREIHGLETPVADSVVDRHSRNEVAAKAIFTD